ncbi:MAG: SCO family protein [Actinomycetia bacterium]|nr:SCO family protein [Actinomycetes bacterium]
MRRSTTHPRSRTYGFATALFASAGLLFAACGGSDSAASTSSSTDGVDTYSGYVVDPPPFVGDVSLPLADGSGQHTMSAVAGGLELVYFGYTFCPDVCPTTMSDVRRVLGGLPEDEAELIDVSVVTVDPARDTADVLDSYVTNFVPDGLSLRTDDDAALRSAADSFGANYEVTTNEAGDIEVSHTGELYAVDDQGQVVMAWPFGTTWESLERDVRSLLAEQPQG